uniref:Uncharacterized protein n=1 Tax=Anguilla anguilla TaxID=7936 RepID=A0A0E9QCE0_ANGAN
MPPTVSQLCSGWGSAAVLPALLGTDCSKCQSYD